MATRAVLVTMALILGATACGGDDGGGAGNDGGPGPSTLRVPNDHATIQEAVDAASPGDLVLIGPGTYHEEVNVTTDDLVIRGLDREEVVLDGGFELENGIRILEADGVAVENLTVQGYTGNGIFWTGVEGYRGSYLTALRNGEYGIYAFGSVVGGIDHTYVAGSGDAGLYIGQCGDCRATVDEVTGEWNGAGYSGTNASNVTITGSTWRRNRTGMVITATSYEACGPPAHVVVTDNVIADNGNADAPAVEAAADVSGSGILLGGARDVTVEGNEVSGNPVAGIAVVPRPDGNPISPVVEEADPACTEATEAADEDLPDLQVWFSAGNRIEGNTAAGNRWDLALIESSEYDNCFSGNEATTSTPPGLQELMPCGPSTEARLETTTFLDAIDAQRSPELEAQEVDLPDPGPLEGMADPDGTAAQPAPHGE